MDSRQTAMRSARPVKDRKGEKKKGERIYAPIKESFKQSRGWGQEKEATEPDFMGPGVHL